MPVQLSTLHFFQRDTILGPPGKEEFSCLVYRTLGGIGSLPRVFLLIPRRTLFARSERTYLRWCLLFKLFAHCDLTILDPVQSNDDFLQPLVDRAQRSFYFFVHKTPEFWYPPS